MASHIERRKFLATLGGAVAAWPLAARAQQPQQMRRVGVLYGRNVRIETRWAAGDADRFRQYAAELVALAPDVVVAATRSA
jgi:putative tryptophan/tyrosine transport system substrate-binding protein